MSRAVASAPVSRCTWASNTLALASAIKRTGGFGSSAGAGRVGMVDTRDVAAVAAGIATDPAAHAGGTYRLTGPALISYADVAAALSGVLGRPVAYHPVSFEEDRAAMIRAGVPEPVAQMNAQAFSLIAAGDAAWLSPDVPALLGRPARSFAQFAADHADAFA